MLHESFSSVHRASDGTVEFRLERLGRAVLGIWCWRFMSLFTDSMLPWERAWWAKYLRRNPAGAIQDYAEARRARGEDVDVDGALAAFARSQKMGDGPWN